MRIDPELGGASIVLIGSLNPSIYNPDWLYRGGAITDAELADSEVNVIHPELTQFRAATFAIKVDHTRFQVETTQAPWVSILDLITKVFGEILVHTPLTAVGINRTVHFGVGAEETRDKIGRMLAPLEPWGSFGHCIDQSSSPARSGLLNITMRENWESDGFKGNRNVTVQPSSKITGGSGIFMNVNYHAELVNVERDGAFPIVSFANENFEAALQRAEEVIDQIMSLREGVK